METNERNRQALTASPHIFGSDDARLTALLDANALARDHRRSFPTPRHEFAALSMSNPIDFERAVAHLGLILGSLGPSTLAMKALAEASQLGTLEFIFVCMMSVAATVTSIVGFYTGRLVGRKLSNLSHLTWSQFLVVTSLLGLGWGIFSGGLGGLLLLVAGAIPGALIGGLAGGVALPLYALFHRIIGVGGLIETKHFLPAAFGIVFVCCAFVLGL